MNTKVAVLGQGYVGLPLALAAAESGYEVVGIDSDASRVESLNAGRSHIGDVADEYLRAQQNNYRATSDFREASNADLAVLCLPTPLNANGGPDTSLLINAAKKISRHLPAHALVINESTVSPGFTRDFLVPIFSGRELAYSPERIDPANKKWTVKNTPKLIAATSETARNRAVEFYSKFVSSISSYSSLEIVETAKLLENSFRLVNISFINEIAEFCDKMGISIQEVISAASTKPFGFMPFYPSIGVGGHCIPLDPHYLVAKAQEIGSPTRFIDLATQINVERPSYFVGIATGILGGLQNKKIIIVGVAYKPDVADTRETPAKKLISLLRTAGAEVFWHDELVMEWNGERSSPLTLEYDLVILLNPHTGTDVRSMGGVPILDTRGSS